MAAIPSNGAPKDPTVGELSALAELHNPDGRFMSRFWTKGHPGEIGSVEVPCWPLPTLMERHSFRECDFFSLDVEGSEEQVLHTVDPRRFKLIMVEAAVDTALTARHHRWPFLAGLAYCTLPLNLMCYLMNDLADVEVDVDNPRKGGDLLGAKEDVGRLRAAVLPAAILQLPFLLAFSWLCGAASAWPWLAAVFGVNWLYNFGPRLSGNYAPLDLVCPCGYILVVPLSCWLNALPYPPYRSWAHAALLVLRTQLWIQTFDIECDAAKDRRNTAVRLGLRRSQLLLAVLLAGETAFVHWHFAHWPLRSLSSGSLALLLAQMLLGSGGAAVAPETINRTFLVLGLGGVGLMARVWLDAAFTR